MASYYQFTAHQASLCRKAGASVSILTDASAALHTPGYPRNKVIVIQLHSRLFSAHHPWHCDCLPTGEEKQMPSRPISPYTPGQQHNSRASTTAKEKLDRIPNEAARRAVKSQQH
jgi:hypothetical protein